MVEDVDGEIVLFYDTFVLLQKYVDQEHNVTITVPMLEHIPPNYLISDRWLHDETRLPISFKHLILPEKFPPPTPLLDLQVLPLSALHNRDFENIYSSTIQTFNKIQTQVSKPSTRRMRMFSLVPRQEAARRSVPNLLYYGYGASGNNLGRSASNRTRTWLSNV
jgi:hypothetical protein